VSNWEEQVESARADFRDQLEQQRFHQVRDHPNRFVGRVATASGQRTVLIELDDWFPYRPPSVFPGSNPKDLDVTWHTDTRGFMCLYVDNDRNSQPWLNMDAFLARVAEWFAMTERGWPDDVPVLDADRYLKSDRSGVLVLYGDLDRMINRYVRLVGGSNGTLTLRLGETPSQRRKKNERRHFAAVRDAGELARPIRTWDDARALLAEDDADTIEEAIREKRIDTVVLRYSRAGRVGVLPLHVLPKPEGFSITVYPAASDAEEVRRFRAGPARDVLAGKRILVVGAGAVGSFTADLLARDGVGDLTIRDYERLTPGNVVRHLCGRGDVGCPKAQAVADRIARDHGVRAHGEADALLPAEARTVLADFDLVVDATADGAVTAMLHHAAAALGTHVVSVCVQNNGEVARVDVLPPLSGDALPKTPINAATGEAFYEGGCGDPVSPTPPHAVVQAAALAAQHTVGLLTGKPLHPAGQIVTCAPAAGDEGDG
jgi:molybdopterin/thiamine biosynthesis adenylyltransferase